MSCSAVETTPVTDRLDQLEPHLGTYTDVMWRDVERFLHDTH